MVPSKLKKKINILLVKKGVASLRSLRPFLTIKISLNILLTITYPGIVLFFLNGESENISLSQLLDLPTQQLR
jgi:hypothetical protein